MWRVPADGNCLFNAIGKALDWSRSDQDDELSQELRNIVAQKIKGNPEKYDRKFLGTDKTP